VAKISHKLLTQSSLSVEALVRQDIGEALAIALDSAALNGTGSAANMPLGILNTTGIGSLSWAAAGAPTWANVVGLETLLAEANAILGQPYYVFRPTLAGVLKTTPKVAGFPVFLMDDNGRVNGYPSIQSTQVPAATALMGNFADLIIGLWGGLNIVVDPYTGASSGNVKIVALMDADGAVRHAMSFAKGINPA